MSGIFGSLQATATTIQAHSKSVELAGRNIAHMNDPNYARQRVIYGSTGTVQTPQGPQSSALTALGFEQMRDALLDKQLLAEISHEKGLEASQLRLQQALSSLGDGLDRADEAKFIDDIATSGGTLRDAIGEFFNTFESFSARPNDPTTKQILLQKSQSLTEEFNRVDGRLENLNTAVDEQIGDDVNLINQKLTELENLNKEVAKLEISRPNSALDVRDQRQAKLEELAELMQFQVMEEAGKQGQIGVYVENESGERHTLMGPETPADRISVNDDGEMVSERQGEAVLNIQAGSLPALIEVRDRDLGQLRDKIDALVENLVGGVNDIYSATGNPFFDDVGVTAATFRLDDDLDFSSLIASATGLSGANEIAREIADLAGEEIADLDGNTFSQFATRLVTDLAQNVQDRSNRYDIQSSVRELIQSRRDEVSGVSVDEEISHLLLYQRAFQASSRVFNVLDDMLNTMVNQFGVR